MFCNAFKETLLLRRRERETYEKGGERERGKKGDQKQKTGGHFVSLLCLGFFPFFFSLFFWEGQKGGGGGGCLSFVTHL